MARDRLSPNQILDRNANRSKPGAKWPESADLALHYFMHDRNFYFPDGNIPELPEDLTNGLKNGTEIESSSSFKFNNRLCNRVETLSTTFMDEEYIEFGYLGTVKTQRFQALWDNRIQLYQEKISPLDAPKNKATKRKRSTRLRAKQQKVPRETQSMSPETRVTSEHENGGDPSRLIDDSEARGAA